MLMFGRSSLVVLAVCLLAASRSRAFLQTPMRRTDCFLNQRLMAEKSRRRRREKPGASSAPSTSELLEELDRRNIRYAPTATRKELEQLLQSENSARFFPKTPESQRKFDNGGGGGVGDVAMMVRELMTKGVRLPPHASRADLQRLLDEQRQLSSETKEESEKSSSKSRKYKHKAIPRLLKELDELGIPYPEDASPATLERLLRTYEDDEKPFGKPPPISPRRRRLENPLSVTVAPFEAAGDSDSRRISTAELLIELNRRGIRFSPTATRGDLEALLQQEKRSTGATRSESKEQRIHRVNPFVVDPGMEEVGTKALGQEFVDDDNDGIPHTRNSRSSGKNRRTRTKRKMESNRSVWSKLYGTSKKTVKHGVFRTIPSYISKTSDGATTRLSQAAERAARKARQVTRSAGNFFAEDENGIRDVDYQYVSKDIPIDVAAVPIAEERRPRAPRKRRESPEVTLPSKRAASTTYPYNSNEQSTLKERRRRRRAPSPSMSRSPPGSRTRRSRKGARDPASGIPKSALATQSNLFRLPPAKDDSSSSGSTEENVKGGNSKSRRIYSPYDEMDLPSQVYRDSIDRFADFLVSTTDKILWGPLDDDDSGDASASKSKKKKHPKGRTSGVRPDGDRISWRDRAEERFDSMLGIHENGEYYNRWGREEEEEELEEHGTDALSYARGQSPKKKTRGRRKGKVYDKPFWDVESTISSLFGRTPPPGYGGIGLGKVGNILPILKAVTKSLVVLGSNACEWATVRGSLPQPVVVVGIFSCTLSARPGRRLLALAVSLFAFRIFGELIHEGLYGDLDWEDDDEEGYEEDASDDNAG